MPKPLQYRTGSLIFFQGDPADKVFIVQSGKVNLVYKNIETGEDMHDTVAPGEFFGVKSALGRYPREENAVAVQDSLILVFTVPEFEALAMSNTRIIMKMLKVFSNQMRRVHNQVSSLMEKEQKDPEAGLFDIGQYYLTNKNFAQAKYVFSRYLTYYPTGSKAQEAAKKLEIAEGSLSKNGASLDTQPEPVKEELTDTAKEYYDAVSLISQQKYQQAYTVFKKIIDADQDEEYISMSSMELGRCLFLLNKFQDCIKHYTEMLNKYPKHPDHTDILFYMGQSHEKSNNKTQAAAIYKKLISMDDEGNRIKAKKALRELEA